MMANADQWANGYARQADADFSTWKTLQDQPVPECHKLLFLQMACEKLCKAHLIQRGTLPDLLQTSHGFISGPLPVVIREQMVLVKKQLKGMHGVLIFTRHLANEIEFLNPSIDRDGRRPDNCEYPWEDSAQTLHSPLDWTFAPSNLLTQRHGATFLKLVRLAITDLLG
ncbi:MAG: hypothetical protein HY289_16255 [Planctomycetes bacterium]|nr:hypothetical protein [Planctomycetota bacterium]